MTTTYAALPIALFPPIHWWLHALDSHIRVDTQRTYHKQTLRNRFSILTCNGPAALSVPIQSTKGMPTPFSEVRMAEGKWRQEHLHAIRSAYGRSAYFEHYYPIIESCYRAEHEYLHQLAKESMVLMLPIFAKKHLTIQFNSDEIQEIDESFSATLEPAYIGLNEPGYPQVFSDRFAFHSNLSCIDVLMNKGPQAIDYILFIKNGAPPRESSTK
jgi:WbqC-like protein family